MPVYTSGKSGGETVVEIPCYCHHKWEGQAAILCVNEGYGELQRERLLSLGFVHG